jgi:hypothetical protein
LDVFAVVDNDDELIGRNTLKLFNAVYQSGNYGFVDSDYIQN